ncbi:MAG: tRNA pseudouridine(38-40) synthase TruA [Synergistales bacterium]|nr:tRNA pseudouridine(38-40) synthase TruA [Synergistales bacterium]
MTYAARIAYEGGAFSGWQRQPNAPTVQAAVEKALALLCGEPVAVTAAGRTDAGVHARSQVISFSTTRERDNATLRKALDANLPDTVAVMDLRRAPPGFDARRDATWREYLYTIWTGHALYPQLRPYVCREPRPVDWNQVQAACALTEGTHDFGAFCRRSERPENSVRTLYRVRMRRRGPLVRLRFRGTAFLTNMVRILAGSYLEVGRGRRSLRWFRDLLEGAQREQAGPTAGAHGLVFWNVGYAPDPFRPERGQ